LNALDSVIYNDSYKREILLTNDHYLVGCTKYAEYPTSLIENSDYWVCIEGKIYGKSGSVLNNEIFSLLNYVFKGIHRSDRERKIIADWLLQTDGDFIIYAFDKNTNDFVIMNDALGRLPFYYYKDKEKIIASREIQFISYSIKDNQENHNIFDKLGLAQLLLFSYTLGNRTPLNNVNRLEPATILRIYCNSPWLEPDTIYRFNFEIKKYSNVSIEKNAGELVSLFSEACRNRADYNAKNIVSLSGGLDSRAVAACLHKNNIPCYAVTSTEPHWRPVEGNISETEIAEQIAMSLGMEWENYGVMKAGAEDLIMLLKIKKGLTYLGHSFFLRFLEKLKKKYGLKPINFFTGRDGGVVFSDLSITISNLDNLDSLARGIIHLVGDFRLAEVAALVQIKEAEIVDELLNILSSYPEENLRQKLLHFLFFEDNAKFSFEIDDISRIYFWTVSPFNSLPFLKYIISCPDKQKSKYRLYREFFFIMSPTVAEIRNSNWGCSISSSRFKIIQSIMSLYWKYPQLRKIIKKLKDKGIYYPYKYDSTVIRCIRDQLDNCSTLSKYLSGKEVEKILNNPADYTHYGFDNLLTVTSLIANTLCDNKSIESHFSD
jgi:asparagine synthase (glutamine-hydrolysing)